MDDDKDATGEIAAAAVVAASDVVLLRASWGAVAAVSESSARTCGEGDGAKAAPRVDAADAG
jgi:hypothetical protein